MCVGATRILPKIWKCVVSSSHTFGCNRYKHVPGVIHIKRDDLLLKHRPWHTMLRSSVGDHSMVKYSSGIYKHMPGGLESLPSFFAPKPVTKLCETMCKASCKRGRVSSQQSDTGTLHLQSSKDQPVRSWNTLVCSTVQIVADACKVQIALLLPCKDSQSLQLSEPARCSSLLHKGSSLLIESSLRLPYSYCTNVLRMAWKTPLSYLFKASQDLMTAMTATVCSYHCQSTFQVAAKY